MLSAEIFIQSTYKICSFTKITKTSIHLWFRQIIWHLTPFINAEGTFLLGWWLNFLLHFTFTDAAKNQATWLNKSSWKITVTRNFLEARKKRNIKSVWWKSIDIYSSYQPQMKVLMSICTTDRQMDGQTDRQMDGHMNIQCETIIPCHMIVAGFKNLKTCLCLHIHFLCWNCLPFLTYYILFHASSKLSIKCNLCQSQLLHCIPIMSCFKKERTFHV